MKRNISLAISGFVTTAIAFGPARLGFGLYLPIFRENFGLSSTEAGLIAGFSFFFFFLSLPLSAWLDRVAGPRTPIFCGAIAATMGMLLVSTSTSIPEMALGIAIAGASAGFCWSPFNDATKTAVPINIQTRTLSVISTGASIGAILLGIFFLLNIAQDMNWRWSWRLFALAGGLAIPLILYAVPRKSLDIENESPKIAFFFNKKTMPIILAAICFGLTNAIFITFATDYISSNVISKNIPADILPASIFISYGLFGLAGLETARFEARLGLYKLVSLIFFSFAISFLLIAFLPGILLAIIISSGLHGASVMIISSILSFWSFRLFTKYETSGFTVILIIVALSSVMGSSIAGIISDYYNLKIMLVGTGIVPIIVAMTFLKIQKFSTPESTNKNTDLQR